MPSGLPPRKLRAVVRVHHITVLKSECINTMITLAESEKGETLMRMSVGMKVGLVSLFSCLALWLGLLSPTGMVSAHTANTLQSAHISSIADRDPNSCSKSTVTFVTGEAPIYGCDRNDQQRIR